MQIFCCQGPAQRALGMLKWFILPGDDPLHNPLHNYMCLFIMSVDIRENLVGILTSFLDKELGMTDTIESISGQSHVSQGWHVCSYILP